MNPFYRFFDPQARAEQNYFPAGEIRDLLVSYRVCPYKDSRKRAASAIRHTFAMPYE
jgi:hypothetical protein